MDLSKFLQIARCPSVNNKQICRAKLKATTSGIVCSECSTLYPFSSFGFPIFAPRKSDEKDKYEDPSQRLAEQYLGIWAFGYRFLKRGEAEGFYRTLNELGFSTSLERSGSHSILEVGCGVGRTICDYAHFYPNAFVVGVDYSERMLEFASQILLPAQSGRDFELSLEKEGFGKLSMKRYHLENVILAQANAMQLPFGSAQFDIALSPNLIDRVPDPEELIRQVARVLKPGGYFIFADPFNWNQVEWWQKCSSLADLETLLLQYNFEIETAFDGLIYREIHDKRNAYSDWPVTIVRAIKK